MLNNKRLTLVSTTEANIDRAEKLARHLLERKLVVCIHLTPINSLYFWNGELRKENEVKLIMKTVNSCLIDLRSAVLEFHSYETPEFISWVADASPEYMQWINSNIKKNNF